MRVFFDRVLRTGLQGFCETFGANLTIRKKATPPPNTAMKLEGTIIRKIRKRLKKGAKARGEVWVAC